MHSVRAAAAVTTDLGAGIYDSERKALAEIRRILMGRHALRGVVTVDQEEAIQRTFTREAIERCADIGLVVDVLWHWETWECPGCGIKHEANTYLCPSCGAEVVRKGSPDVSDNPDDPNLYWNPAIVVTARTEKTGGYDHEKQQHEVQSGLFTGKVGGIREDGSLREDLRKKSYGTISFIASDPAHPVQEEVREGAADDVPDGGTSAPSPGTDPDTP